MDCVVVDRQGGSRGEVPVRDPVSAAAGAAALSLTEHLVETDTSCIHKGLSTGLSLGVFSQTDKQGGKHQNQHGLCFCRKIRWQQRRSCCQQQLVLLDLAVVKTCFK